MHWRIYEEGSTSLGWLMICDDGTWMMMIMNVEHLYDFNLLEIIGRDCR